MAGNTGCIAYMNECNFYPISSGGDQNIGS